MNASFIFSTDAFDHEIDIPADAVGNMHKLEPEEALAKAKVLAKAKAMEMLDKVYEQIDAQTFDDVFGADEADYSY